jgi:hypothetical protein
MLMIWSSRARNRSPDIVASGFFGRIVPSDATKESRFGRQGNLKNEIARFLARGHRNLAIANQQIPAKTESQSTD